MAIIALGLFSELAVRSRIFVEGDAGATAFNLANSEVLFRLAFLADSLMLLCEVALAVLLHGLLEPVSRSLSLMAASFRLTQAAVLGMSLLHYYSAILLLRGVALSNVGEVASLVYQALELHRHGYDLGLLFFAANCLVLGYLVLRASFIPKFFGVLLIAAGFTYFVGSYTRFLFPGAVLSIAPIYLVAVAAEVAFCAWLLSTDLRANAPTLEMNS